MMDILEATALIVFIITYLLIAVHKTPWFEIKRSYAAVLGALVMLIIGALTLQEAFDAIDLNVIFLLLGMMTLVAGLEYTGFFTLVSDILVRKASSGGRLLLMIMAVSAFLSAVALNDAVVLMFTPIVIRCCIKIDVNPIPYLVGLMMSANIGSIATAVGNPQNAYIISYTGMDFAEYSLYCIPIAVLCLIAAYLLLYLIFRKGLNRPYDCRKDVCEEDIAIDRRRLCLMLLITVGSFIGFILSGTFGYKLCYVALIAGALSLIVVMSSRPADCVWVARRVDWNILLFFIGLFVLIGGAVHSGLISDISSLFPGFREGEVPNVISLSLFSVVLSNLVSNVPAVMLITEMMPVSQTSLWITLAVSSTIAGNTTLIGSAANIIVAERADGYGVKIDFLRFMVVGLIVTAVTLTIMIVCIELIF